MLILSLKVLMKVLFGSEHRSTGVQRAQVGSYCHYADWTGLYGETGAAQTWPGQPPQESRYWTDWLVVVVVVTHFILERYLATTFSSLPTCHHQLPHTSI